MRYDEIPYYVLFNSDFAYGSLGEMSSGARLVYAFIIALSCS